MLSPAEPSRVAIDLRMVGTRPHGIARYALALWEGLPAAPDLRYVAICAPDRRVALPRPSDRVLIARAPFLSPLEQIELPLLLRHAGADVLHATSHSVPAAWRGPLVLTLHDVNHLALPGWAHPGRAAFLRTVVGAAARRAGRVLTVSRFAAEEISRRLEVPAARIAVAPNAVEPRFAPVPADRVAGLRARLGLPPDYLLVLTNGREHKNTRFLGEVSARFPLPLVWAGGPRVEAPNVAWLAAVPEADLPALYTGASLFLFPSRYEGFGLPPLEAAACGAPVLAGRGSATDEIWEGTGALLPPDRPAAWVEAVRALIEDPARRAALAAACRARAGRYRSWEPAVRAAALAYQFVLRPA